MLSWPKNRVDCVSLSMSIYDIAHEFRFLFGNGSNEKKTSNRETQKAYDQRQKQNLYCLSCDCLSCWLWNVYTSALCRNQCICKICINTAFIQFSIIHLLYDVDFIVQRIVSVYRCTYLWKFVNRIVRYTYIHN